MSKLDELIKKLCPDGVKYKRIFEIADTSIGLATSVTKNKATSGVRLLHNSDIQANRIEIKKEEYITETFAKKNSGKILQYHDIITVHTGDVGTSAVIEEEYAGSVGFTTITTRIKSFDEVSPYYLCHYLNSGLCKKDIAKDTISDRSNLNQKSFEKLIVPVPPLDVQCEIVRILDKFEELTETLEAELELRNKQYEEIAYRLLFDNHESEKRRIKDICTLTKGKSPIQKTEPGEYPMVVTTSERKSSSTYQFDDEAVCIPLVSSRGHGVASLNHVYYQEGKFALGNILCALVSKDDNYVSMKYLYYYFECTKDYTLVPLMKGGANVSMHIPDIEKVKVPIPSIEKQKEIISTLEKLGEYCFELLPVEIEARQKQYEYYRDKLLTFKEVV